MPDKTGAILYCGSCKEACNLVWEDHGIGPNEYWGSKSVDVQLVGVSDCCSDGLFYDAACTEEYDDRDWEEDFNEPYDDY